VAVCYTKQRLSWWKKVVEDVREAVASSPAVKEVVIVIPHNVDRDGPKDKSKDWFSEAQEIAGEARLRVIDGRDFSFLLDLDHQDLRYEHLAIPYSRLSGPSILAGCQSASVSVISSIQTSGRYDPDHYSLRSADKELYRLWQAALRHGLDNDRRIAPVRLIALVNDSGVGKTSLVCEFTRSLGSVLPVLLLQARDLMFGTEDSLVACVIQTIQEVLDPAARIIEEAALAKHLAGSVRLTVVLDGLDEARNPEAVRRAITFWLRSKVGQSSILIVTSRQEFWKTCADASWVRWMPRPDFDDRSPVKVADKLAVERSDPTAGFQIPDRFSEEELEAAWLRAGHVPHELFTLSAEAREELRHPFTLRVFLDLQLQEGHVQRTVTRVALMESWLSHRLEAEAIPSERITPSQFQKALRIVASRIGEASAGSLAVDELEGTGVPRFESAHPPGPVVQRLIEANILETLPGQSDHIRFSIEAVQDFYRAEADIEEIKLNPELMAERFSRLSFTSAYTRLVRIGHRLVGEEVANAFARRLAELDARKASIVLRAAPDTFSMDIRARVVGELGSQISARHRVRAALAITLLGELNCRESIETLASCLFPPSDVNRNLKSLGATAFIKLGYAAAAAFVYTWGWFGLRSGSDTYYFKELLATIRGATPDFRSALAEKAVQQLDYATGTKEHAKAVTVLAYLGDTRLVIHLATRLSENGLLAYYENHALIALGVDAAGALFARSVSAVGEQLALLSSDQSNHDARNNLSELVYFPVYDVRYLLTPAFDPHLKRLIEEASPHVSWSASDLAKRGLVESLLYPAAVAAANRKSWIESGQEDQRTCVNADVWLGWWKQSTDDQVRRKLLNLLPLYPNSSVEEVLIDSLDSSELRGSAARRLGEYGSIRSAARLREILAEEIRPDDHWDKSQAAQALGDLRDDTAVALLEKLAAEHPDD